MARFALASISLINACLAQTFNLIDYSINENGQYQINVNWKSNNHQSIIALTNTEDKSETEFCEFFNENSCLVDLSDGSWRLVNSEGNQKIDVNIKHESLIERRTKNKVNSPKARSVNSEWLPVLHSTHPNRPGANKPGQKFELYGEDLFPRHADPIAGKMLEIYFSQGSNEYPCEINAYWSNDDRLVCTTPNLPAGTYQTKVRYLDDFSQQMVDAKRINPQFYDCGNCNANFEERTSDAKITGFYNRFINGMDDGDQSFDTAWIDGEQIGGGRLPSSIKTLYKHLRNRMCDQPLSVEFREKSTKKNLLEIPEIVFDDEPRLNHGGANLYDIKSSLSSGIWNTTHEFKEFIEMKLTCDKQFVAVRGWHEKDMSFASFENPEEGIQVPVLLSSKDSSQKVGGCMLRYDGAEYPNSMEGNNHFTFYCRPVVDEDFHGGVNFEVSNDNRPIWGIGKESNAERFNPDAWLLGNDLTYKYNTYIAPAIKSIELEGCNVLVIKGNKFTETPVVKVGYQDCEVINYSETEIRCEIQESSGICQDATEYPGNPGLTGHLFDKYNEGFKGGDVEKNPESSAEYKWTAHVQDGWVQSSPHNWLENGNPGINAGDDYSMSTKGWFVAPRTGYYKFLSFGDDGFFFKYNNLDSQCPINVTNEDWYENGAILTGAATWTYPNEFRHDQHIIDTVGQKHHNYRQVSDERFYLEKGENFYVSGAFSEGGGGDYIILGAVYVGDKLDASGNAILPNDVIQDETMRLTEKQLFKVTQEKTQHKQVISVAGDNGVPEDLSIELTFNDGIRSKSVEISYNSDNTVNEDIYNEVFATKCTYPESLSIWQKLDYEDSTWGVYNLDKKFKTQNTWCGHQFNEIESKGVHQWLWHHNADYTLLDGSFGKPGAIDLFQDSNIVNSFCFAYFERLDQVQMKLKVYYNDGESENNRNLLINLNAGGKKWKFECLNFLDLLNNDDWYTEKQGVYSLELKEMRIKNFDNGDGDLMLIDDFILGYTDSHLEFTGDGGDMVRIQGLLASDGRGISKFNANREGNHFEFTARREWNDELDRSQNAVCGWTLPTASVTKINGVSVSSSGESVKTTDREGNVLYSWALGKFESYTDGQVTIESHHEYNPSSGWSGSFTIEGENFDVATTDESDIVEFYAKY